MRSDPVLVTGATGYVGGRLVPQLLDAGYRVRVVGRSLDKLQSRPWSTNPNTEMVVADALNYESVEKAARDCWAAFYLVHSMNPRNKDFAEADRKAAHNMAKAAAKNRLERIVYLGGFVQIYIGAVMPGVLSQQALEIKDRSGQNFQSRVRSYDILTRSHDPGFRECIL